MSSESGSSTLGLLAGIGMAVGPPLIYVDQDVCGVIMIANIMRCFFYLGHPFETPLLVQSILLIISQFALLALCLRFKPAKQYAIVGASGDDEEHHEEPEFDETESHHDQNPSSSNHHHQAMQSLSSDGTTRKAQSSGGNPSAAWTRKTLDQGRRPFDFWQWDDLMSYVKFLGGLIVVLAILQIFLGRFSWYVEPLGLVALSIESTLPIPQFINNYKRKSTEGFQDTTLAGWLFGDTFKTFYYFIRGNPVQFKITAIVTLSWDCAVLYQRLTYRRVPIQAQTTESV